MILARKFKYFIFCWLQISKNKSLIFTELEFPNKMLTFDTMCNNKVSISMEKIMSLQSFNLDVRCYSSAEDKSTTTLPTILYRTSLWKSLLGENKKPLWRLIFERPN